MKCGKGLCVAGKAAGKFSKKAQNSGLGLIIDEAISRGSHQQAANHEYAIDFVESRTGLGIDLFPAQRIVFKLSYGVPLDYKPQMVPVYDSLKTKLKYTLTEWDFVRMLYDEGRCNVEDWRDVPAWGFGTTVLVAGRRSGKSEIVGAMAGTSLKQLLSLYNPQDYYKLVEGSPIDFTFLGTDDKSSTRLYDKVKANITRSPFYGPYLRAEPGAKEMMFVAESDRHRRDINPSIKLAAYPCTTRAVRGPSSYFLAFDEFAHFRSNKDANSDDMFEDATASTGMFPSVDDPDRADSKTLVISSPVSKIGKFYELHKHAMDGGIASNILTFRMPTAEVNPRFPGSKLREAHAKDPVKFAMEYEAIFSDGAGSYVQAEKLEVLINKRRENIVRFNMAAVGRKYFWGLDYATKKDATALAIGHLEPSPKGVVLIYDYIERMMVGEEFKGPGVANGKRIVNLTELDLVDIVSWLVFMNQILPCYKGLTDQHAGTTLKQLLQMNGISSMELVHLNEQINSKMYLALQGYINNATASFPNVPKFQTEFNQLNAEYKSKYVLKVEAPNEKGAHDDMADAVALVAWMAQKWIEEEGHLDMDPSGKILQVDPRIANPISIIDPNSVSLRDLQMRFRQEKMGDGLMLPPGLAILPSKRRW